MKLTNFWFTALHSSVFGKVRELVGEIKYAFDSEVAKLPTVDFSRYEKVAFSCHVQVSSLCICGMDRHKAA